MGSRRLEPARPPFTRYQFIVLGEGPSRRSAACDRGRPRSHRRADAGRGRACRGSRDRPVGPPRRPDGAGAERRRRGGGRRRRRAGRPDRGAAPRPRGSRQRGVRRPVPRSSHVLPVEQLVALAAALRGSPPRGVLVGVGCVSFGLGESMSPAVVAAIPAFTAAIRTEIERLVAEASFRRLACRSHDPRYAGWARLARPVCRTAPGLRDGRHSDRRAPRTTLSP